MSESLHTPASDTLGARGAAAPAREPPHATPPDPRDLPDQATFGDLVQSARHLDDTSNGHSTAGCLLRTRERLRLEADLSPGARPLPPVPERAIEGEPQQPSGGIGVMTTWGTIAGESSDPILLAFTTTSLGAFKLPAIGVFATSAGVVIRAADRSLRTEHPLSAEDAGTWLARSNSAGTVYLTADRNVPVRTALAVARFIPNRFEVALAVTLPSATRLPRASGDNNEGLCADGLPAPAPTEAEGELTAAMAQSAVAPLRDAALKCALQAGGRALLGGKLVLALRVDANGKTRETCFPQDAIREPLLRRCLLGAVRDLSLPRPSPSGFADLHVPLQIELTGPAPQRASCD
ncbi:MAG: hypothetical protein ABW321_03325 [Polyangiales bacterium]